MSGSTVSLVSGFEGETLFALRNGTSPNSHLPPHDHDHIEPTITPLYEDSDSERVFEDSLDEGTSLSCSLESPLSNFGR